MKQEELNKLPEQFKEKVAMFGDDWAVLEVTTPSASPVVPYELAKINRGPFEHCWYIEVQDGKIVGAPPELKAMLGWTGKQLADYLKPRGMQCTKLTF